MVSNILNVIGKIPENNSEKEFEDLYFSYNPEDDPNGSRGIGLADAVIKRAKGAGLSLKTWINLHRFYYQMRQDNLAERYHSH